MIQMITYVVAVDQTSTAQASSFAAMKLNIVSNVIPQILVLIPYFPTASTMSAQSVRMMMIALPAKYATKRMVSVEIA